MLRNQEPSAWRKVFVVDVDDVKMQVSTINRTAERDEARKEHT